MEGARSSFVGEQGSEGIRRSWDRWRARTRERVSVGSRVARKEAAVDRPGRACVLKQSSQFPSTTLGQAQSRRTERGANGTWAVVVG